MNFISLCVLNYYMPTFDFIESTLTCWAHENFIQPLKRYLFEIYKQLF